MQNLKESIVIRSAKPADAAAIVEIYNHYVNQTSITFEEKPVTPSEFKHRIGEILALALPWFVAESNHTILGYAYAGKWKARTAYRFSVEVTVYVSPAHLRHGIGSRLYKQLLPVLKAKGVHTAIGGIALPNPSSIGLHESFGFKKAAHFKDVGYKFNRWIDVGYWQRII